MMSDKHLHLSVKLITHHPSLATAVIEALPGDTSNNYQPDGFAGSNPAIPLKVDGMWRSG
jgi:hypothetical protein